LHAWIIKNEWPRELPLISTRHPYLFDSCSCDARGRWARARLRLRRFLRRRRNWSLNNNCTLPAHTESKLQHPVIWWDTTIAKSQWNYDAVVSRIRAPNILQHIYKYIYLYYIQQLYTLWYVSSFGFTLRCFWMIAIISDYVKKPWVFTSKSCTVSETWKKILCTKYNEW